MCIRPIDVNFLHDGERNSLTSGKLADGLGRARLLLAELVARPRDDLEALVLVLVVQRNQLLVVGRLPCCTTQSGFQAVGTTDQCLHTV